MKLFLLLLVLLVVGAIYFYNRLVGLKNKVEESWSGIDVQLKRRYDLIPNLVNTVKGYASHESETLQKVIEARNQAMSVGGGDAAAKGQAESMLAGSLKSLFALAESYPDLKANTSFVELQKSLTEIEENVSGARRYYNAIVRDNNTAVETFPSSLFANAFNFQKYDYFELESASERANPEVKF